MNVTVNGVVYNRVAQDKTTGVITLSSTKPTQSLLTTLEELQTQYGRRPAFAVQTALLRR